MGGFNGTLRLNTVERYHLDKNQWEMIEPMNRKRSDAGAASLGDNVS